MEATQVLLIFKQIAILRLILALFKLQILILERSLELLILSAIPSKLLKCNIDICQKYVSILFNNYPPMLKLGEITSSNKKDETVIKEIY